MIFLWAYIKATMRKTEIIHPSHLRIKNNYYVNDHLFIQCLLWTTCYLSVKLNSTTKFIFFTELTFKWVGRDVYSVPNTILSILYVLTHLILTTTLWGIFINHIDFTNENQTPKTLSNLAKDIQLVSCRSAIWLRPTHSRAYILNHYTTEPFHPQIPSRIFALFQIVWYPGILFHVVVYPLDLNILLILPEMPH